MPSSGTPLCSAESRPFDSPVCFGEHLGHHHARFDALHQERSEVAMQRADVVFLPQSETGADDDRFLSDAGVDAAPDFALLHQRAESFVECSDELEPEEHVEQLLWGELELGPLDRRHGWRSLALLGAGGRGWAFLTRDLPRTTLTNYTKVRDRSFRVASVRGLEVRSIMTIFVPCLTFMKSRRLQEITGSARRGEADARSRGPQAASSRSRS